MNTYLIEVVVGEAFFVESRVFFTLILLRNLTVDIYGIFIWMRGKRGSIPLLHSLVFKKLFIVYD